MFLSIHLTAILSAGCLPLRTLAMPHVEARAGSVCSSGIYGELAPVLAEYSAAQSYCTSKYPIPCTTGGGAKVKRSHTSTKITSTKSSSATTKTKTPTTSSTNAQASALSILQQQVASAVSTLCSCIETPTACPTPTCVSGCQGQYYIACGNGFIGVGTTTGVTTSNVASYLDCENICTSSGSSVFDYYISTKACVTYADNVNDGNFDVVTDSNIISGTSGTGAC